jgi:hypothetical protein
MVKTEKRKAQNSSARVNAAGNLAHSAAESERFERGRVRIEHAACWNGGADHRKHKVGKGPHTRYSLAARTAHTLLAAMGIIAGKRYNPSHHTTGAAMLSIHL